MFRYRSSVFYKVFLYSGIKAETRRRKIKIKYIAVFAKLGYWVGLWWRITAPIYFARWKLTPLSEGTQDKQCTRVGTLIVANLFTTDTK